MTAQSIAGIVAAAIGSLDKIYRGFIDFNKNRGSASDAPPPDLAYSDDAETGAFIATSRHTGAPVQTVTYAQLCERLSEDDLAYVRKIEQAMQAYRYQWEDAYVAFAEAAGADKGRYRAQLERLSKDISDPLLRILDMVERMGLHLDDHYEATRQIAREVVGNRPSG